MSMKIDNEGYYTKNISVESNDGKCDTKNLKVMYAPEGEIQPPIIVSESFAKKMLSDIPSIDPIRITVDDPQ